MKQAPKRALILFTDAGVLMNKTIRLKVVVEAILAVLVDGGEFQSTISHF